MVQREHRVSLAATEVGLKIHHRARPGLAIHSPQSARQQVTQTLGEVGAGEELDRVPVLRAGRLPSVNEV